MVENIENTEDPITPPLPKGFKVIKKEPEAPPLPSGFTPLKKKESTESTSTTTPSSGGSAPKTGSSGGVNPFPKANIPSPIPDFDSVWKEKKSVEKPKTFRLPNEADEVERQRRGITPPPSEMLKQTANNTKAIYDLDANGNVIPEKPNKLFAGLKKQDKTKGFYQQGEELVKQNKDIQNGFSEKTTFELDGGKLIPKTTVKDFKTSEGIDKEIENNDLNLDHPYLYYSTFNKENQPKDTFVESNFGENKLADLGINTADFDGFLNKKGYKAEFLEKEANGLFEGKGADLTGGYNIQLAKEIQKQRLLNLYMQDINSRDFAKRKLNQEKVNLGKLGADREQLNTQYTLFDSNKVGAFYEKEMPILTQKLKERDAENKKIYDTHKNGDTGFFYGPKQVLNSGWNGFLDRINQTSSTMLDKIGLDSGADELRLLNEERQFQRPNTRDVGYASGRTTTYDGVKYLVTNDGQIIDQDKKIRVTDLFFKPTYDAIVNKSKSGEEDSVFSFQGSAIQAGGVFGDMIVQYALQIGVGLASGATVKAGSLLSKIPISKSIGSAIIAQSALGYSQGLEQTYKAAIDAGIDEKTAKVLATDSAQRMAGLYAITAPISPQTKAIEGIFGSEGKELIKKAIAAYTQTGKKGFIETFKQGGKQLSKNAIIFTEEGGKEVFQENTQQTGESYGVNASINRDIGRELLKETISGDEFVNTSILSFGSGGLMTLRGMFSSTDKLKTLQQLSKDPLAFEKNLKELVSKGVFTNDKADVLRKDVKIYSNQSHKIPKNLNKDIAMDVMSDLEDISQLEVKKKGLDKSFHEEIDAEIEAKRTGIRDRINFVGLSKKEIATLKETASDELIAEAKEQGKKEFKFDNKQITERANKIYAKQVKENKKKENEQTPPTPEAQPQAEVEKIDVEKTKYRIAELNNELEQNRIRVEKGEISNRSNKEIKAEIAKLESKLPKESVVTFGVSESFNKAGENAKSKQDGKVIGRWILDNSKVGDTITISDGTGYEITNSKNGEIEITPFETNEKGDREYVREGVRLVTENQLKQGDLFETSYTNSKGDRVTEKYTYNEAEVPQQAQAEKVATPPVEDVVATSVEKPSDEQQLEDVKNGDIVSFTYGDKSEIPEIFKDKISSEGEINGKKEIKVTIAKSLAEYHLQNEKSPTTNSPTNGNVSIGATNVGESGVSEQEVTPKVGIQNPVDGGKGKADVEVTIGKNNHKFYTGRKTKIEDFSKTKGEFIFFSKDKKVSEHYGGDNITEANVDTSGFLDLSTQEKKTAFVKENFTDEDIHKLYPNIKRNAFDRQTNIKGFEEIEKEIIQGYRTSLENNRFSGDGEVQNAILRKIKAKGHTGVVLEDSFFGKKDMSYVVFDKSVINSGKPTETPQPKVKDIEVSDLDHAKDQIDKGVLQWNGSMEIGSPRVNLGISWADIRKGEADIKRGKENTVPAKLLIEALKIARENGGYEYVQGYGGQMQKQFVSLEDIQKANNEHNLTDAEQKEVDANEAVLAQEYEDYFGSLDLQTQNDIYENQEGIDGMGEESTASTESKNDVSDKKGTPKPTTRKTAAERIKASNATIDDLKNSIKGIDEIFGIKIKVGDIDGLSKQGIDIVDVIANIAKQAVAAGIHIDEAISKTIEHLKKTMDFEVDVDAIKERINPKKEAKNEDGFKRVKHESSVLKRIREGGNSDKVNQIIDEIGLNFTGRKQDQVYADGVNFVKEVGVVEAYNSIKNGYLKHSDTINVVYATILQEFNKMAEIEISKASDGTLNEITKELDEFHERIYTEFKARTIDQGQGSAILNFIYNNSIKVKYSLSQQIDEYKKINNGIIPSDVLSRMKELDKQYKESNKRIEELESMLKEAQEQQYFENIVEEQNRAVNIPKSKREKALKIIKALDDFEKSILKNSYSDVTMITPILIQGIRATKIAIKQGVEISEAIEKGIEGIKKELNKLGKSFDSEDRFRKDLRKSLEDSGIEIKTPKVTVDKTGKVIVPTEMIKEYISKGGRDLSEFAEQVHNDIKEDFPDVTIRDIRESVSNYGKKANKTRTQMEDDIRMLKAEERLRIEYEDLQNRITREKNETKRQKLSRVQRRLKAQIKEIQDQLGITEQERTNRAVNYTKKRIEFLRERIKNYDFSKKEIKPIVESKELREARLNKNKIQEEFDYLSYLRDIENRTTMDKLKSLGGDLYDSQRVTLATGELSFVGAQGGFYVIDNIFSRKTLKSLIETFKGTTVKEWKTNPFKTALKTVNSVHSAKALIKMFDAMGTANNYNDMQTVIRENPNYDTWKKSGLRLLSEDPTAKARDENFIGNNILTILKMPIHLIDKIEKKELLNYKLKLAEEEKKRTTFQGYIEKIRTGNVSEKNKKTITEIFSNTNPLSVFERGNNIFLNMARIEMFEEYATLLYASGKNPVDHLDDFKKLASAINTITGSGNMGRNMTMALPILNKIMFSARYFAASWNLTPPFSLYYLAKLGNYDQVDIDRPSTWKNIKTTPAQKAFLKPMVKGFVVLYGASYLMVSMINAAIDDDDEMSDEEKEKRRAYIEYDPRSSEFMQVVSGDAATDLFGPYRSNVVLLSKVFTSQTKNNVGEIIDNGAVYGSRKDFAIVTEYLAGKSNPTPGMAVRYSMGANEDVLNVETGKEEKKRMLFGEDVSFKSQINKNLYPIFVETVKAVNEDDPVLGATFYNLLALYGKQTNVYTKRSRKLNPEDEFKTIMQKRKEKSELTIPERITDKVENKLSRAEGKIKEIERMKMAQKLKVPYYTSSGYEVDVTNIDFSKGDKGIEQAKENIAKAKLKYDIKDKDKK